MDTTLELNLTQGISLYDLLRRPEITSNHLNTFFDIPEAFNRYIENLEFDIKYEGYVKRMYKDIDKKEKIEKTVIPESLDIATIKSLSNEVREKLITSKPHTLGQASRISGITPAAISILSIMIKKHCESA